MSNLGWEMNPTPLYLLGVCRSERAGLLDLCKRIANDDGLNDLIQGIGEKPDWWDELHAAIAKAEASNV